MNVALEKILIEILTSLSTFRSLYCKMSRFFCIILLCVLETRKPANYPHSFNITIFCKMGSHAIISITTGFMFVYSARNVNRTSYLTP